MHLVHSRHVYLSLCHCTVLLNYFLYFGKERVKGDDIRTAEMEKRQKTITHLVKVSMLGGARVGMISLVLHSNTNDPGLG